MQTRALIASITKNGAKITLVSCFIKLSGDLSLSSFINMPEMKKKHGKWKAYTGKHQSMQNAWPATTKRMHIPFAISSAMILFSEPIFQVYSIWFLCPLQVRLIVCAKHSNGLIHEIGDPPCHMRRDIKIGNIPQCIL